MSGSRMGMGGSRMTRDSEGEEEETEPWEIVGCVCVGEAVGGVGLHNTSFYYIFLGRGCRCARDARMRY